MTLRNRETGAEETLPVSGLFVMIGAVPGTGWLPEEVGREEHGFVLTGSDAAADPQWHEDRPLMLGVQSVVDGPFLPVAGRGS